MLQSQALNILKTGQNVFLTGPAGSGKTHVLNTYVNYLKSHGVDVAVTASTGIAATHIGGQTIHSWSGLGIRGNLTDYDVEDLLGKSYLYKRFARTKVLVIDEISMLHSYRLDLIEWIARSMKRNSQPFGGMQIVVCGDFFQLPPISKGDENNESNGSSFAYKAESWKRAKFSVCYIDEQHRQRDKNYLAVLNEIRSGKASKKTIDLLLSRMHADADNPEHKDFTRLYTHNIDVDTVNKRHLDLIKDKSKNFQMNSRGARNLVDTLKKSCLSPEILELKVGAKVMFTKNHPEGMYVNGSLGTIKQFSSYGDPVVLLNSGVSISVGAQSWNIEEEGKVKAEISQLPLRLAWAITVHKSQGMSLESMEVDLSKSFVKGMGYVALSRVRTLSGIKLLGLNEMALEVDKEILEKDGEFRILSEDSEDVLKKMTEEELRELHDVWMKKIEPEEKVKIRKKTKSSFSDSITRSNEARFREKEIKLSTADITRTMLEQEMPLQDIAEARGVKQETIVSHIEDILADESREAPDIAYLKREFGRGELEEILAVFERIKTPVLAPVFGILKAKKKNPTYLKIRLARLFWE